MYHPYKTSNFRIKGLKSPPLADTRYRIGDIVFAHHVEFEGNAGSKARPILYLGCDGNSVRYMKCTTVQSDRAPQVPVGDPISAGLEKNTYIIPVVKHIDRSNLKYRLGHLCKEDLEYLQENITN